MKITEFIKTAGTVAIHAQQNDKEETKRYIAEVLQKQGEEVEGLKVDVDGEENARIPVHWRRRFY